MDTVYKWHNKTLGERVVKALEKNYFHAVYVDKAEDAGKYILDNIKKGDKVGLGGSATIKSLNIEEVIKGLGAEILDHGIPELSPEEKLSIRRAQLISDVFLCSSNAITLDGKLVNVDGVGNRVAAMTFGPKKVIVVVGVNKICEDEEAAFERIRMKAAPMNTKRLGLNTPCTETGICVNCKNEGRICSAYSILRKKPSATDITILIVGESLGF